MIIKDLVRQEYFKVNDTHLEKRLCILGTFKSGNVATNDFLYSQKCHRGTGKLCQDAVWTNPSEISSPYFRPSQMLLCIGVTQKRFLKFKVIFRRFWKETRAFLFLFFYLFSGSLEATDFRSFLLGS